MDFTTHEATELYFHAKHDRSCCTQLLEPAWRNLERKHRRGTFDRDRAIKLLRQYTLRAVARSYTREFGGNIRMFAPPVREEVAQRLLWEFLDELAVGNSWVEG